MSLLKSRILSAQCHCLVSCANCCALYCCFPSFLYYSWIQHGLKRQNLASVASQESRKREKKRASASLSSSGHASSESSGSQFDFIADLSHNLTSCLPDMQGLFIYFYFLSPCRVISFTICLQPRLLAADYSPSPSVPLQDEKNQVLITNAWLQLVCLLSKHFLCDHCVIIVI